MTPAARASRKKRSTPTSLRKAAPPQTRIARSSDFVGGFARRSLALQHAQHSVGAIGGDGRQRVAEQRLGMICLDPHAGDVASDGGKFGQRGPRIAMTTCGSTCSTVRRIAPAIKPFEQAALRTAKTGSTTPIMMSKPLPSPPSIAERGDLDVLGGNRRRVVAAQPEAFERRSLDLRGPAKRREPARWCSAPSAGERPRRPDVSRRVRCGGDPALGCVQTDIGRPAAAPCSRAPRNGCANPPR